MSTWELEDGRYGPRLVLKGRWSPAVVTFMQVHDIRELMLNYARGWSDDNVDFLSEADFLRGLVLINWTMKSDAPVGALHQLEHLQLSTYCSNPMDFSRFPHLEDCTAFWRKGMESLFNAKTLKRLFLARMPDRDLKRLSTLRELLSLEISEGQLASTAGIRALRNLQHLGLFHLRQLASLAEVSQLRDLRVLEVQSCTKLRSLDEVDRLETLQRLQLEDCGPIESLKPLQSLTQLSELFFAGTTNILDGDLSVLFELPNLKLVAFQQRKHYSHSREAIQAHVKSR